MTSKAFDVETYKGSLKNPVIPEDFIERFLTHGLIHKRT